MRSYQLPHVKRSKVPVLRGRHSKIWRPLGRADVDVALITNNFILINCLFGTRQQLFRRPPKTLKITGIGSTARYQCPEESKHEIEISDIGNESNPWWPMGAERIVYT